MLSARSTYWIAPLLLAAQVLVGLSASGIEEAASGGGGEPSAEPYAFSYSADSLGGYSDRQESGDASGRVQGFYTMMGDDGRMRRVDYVADENGYRATISTNEMGTRTGPTGDAMYTVAQPSAGQLEAARVTAAEYAALESPHLLAARAAGPGRMTLARDEEALRARLQAAQAGGQQQQQVQQQSTWRAGAKQRTSSSVVRDQSTAQETSLNRQAIPSYQQQQQAPQRADRRWATNNIRANLKVSDLRQMWVNGIDVEQQQQSNVIDTQEDQMEINTTTQPSAPFNEPQLTPVRSQPRPLPAREQTVQTESPEVGTTADQEQVDVMAQTSTRAAATSTTSTTTTTTTEQPTTTSASPATATVEEQEQPVATTQETASPTSQADSQQTTTQQVVTTTRQLQKTPGLPSTTQQPIVTRTSQVLTTEPTTTTTTTTVEAKTTRKPIVIIETNRAALTEQPEQQQQQVSRMSFESVKGSGWRPSRGPSRKVQQEPTRILTTTDQIQERSTRAPVLLVPVNQQQSFQSSLASAQGTKGAPSKTGARQQAFWRARMLRNSQTPVGESAVFGARTSALN